MKLALTIIALMIGYLTYLHGFETKAMGLLQNIETGYSSENSVASVSH